MSYSVPKRVLVVDDEPSILDLLNMLLNMDGYCTETASSGDEALQKFTTGTFDAVLTDWRMPGMDGTELASAIKARHDRKPVILISGLPPTRPVKEVDAVIAKPIEWDILRKELAGVFAA